MYTVGIVTFKCVKGLVPSYLSDCFVTGSIVYDRNTRDKDYLNIPAYQLPAGQRTFLYRAIYINSTTYCHVQSLLWTACILSKRNLENSFLNHFLSARRATY